MLIKASLQLIEILCPDCCRSTALISQETLVCYCWSWSSCRSCRTLWICIWETKEAGPTSGLLKSINRSSCSMSRLCPCFCCSFSTNGAIKTATPLHRHRMCTVESVCWCTYIDIYSVFIAYCCESVFRCVIESTPPSLFERLDAKISLIMKAFIVYFRFIGAFYAVVYKFI